MLRTLLTTLLLVFALLGSPAWANPVDINTATLPELDALPGIGPAKAQAIIDHRAQNGPFQRIEDIQQVTGIGPATFANIQAFITVAASGEAPTAPPASAPPPTATGPSASAVNINSATAAELQTLPGIGASKAQAIVDDRTANGPFATCQDLTRVTGIGPATVANLGASCVTQ